MSLELVIDASVLIQIYVLEPTTARAKTLVSGLIKPEPDELHVPEFRLLECANILWKHVRFSRMTVAHAQESIQRMRGLTLTIHPAASLLPRALEIGLDHKIAIYDSLYIALAESLKYPLVTADENQSRAASTVGVTLKPLSDFSEFVD
jgi:predicted nucleic acid-binding protein